MLTLTVGRGNHRRNFVLPSGREYRDLKKNQPVEAVKITGNILAISRTHAAALSRRKESIPG
jgi:hypothetical protein